MCTSIFQDLYFLFSPSLSQLSRCSTAKGSNTGCSLVGSPKIKPLNSFLLTEGLLKVDQNGDRVSKSNQSCHIWNMRQKRFFAKYEECGTILVLQLNLFDISKGQLKIYINVSLFGLNHLTK